MKEPSPHTILAKDTLASNLKRPLYYDEGSQFILCQNGRMVVDIRGWGWIQKLDKAEQRQDAVGQHICDLINASLDPTGEITKDAGSKNQVIDIKTEMACHAQAFDIKSDECIRLNEENIKLKNANTILQTAYGVLEKQEELCRCEKAKISELLNEATILIQEIKCREPMTMGTRDKMDTFLNKTTTR